MKIEKLPSGSYRVRKMIDGKTMSLTFDKKPTQKEINKAILDRQSASVTLQNAPRKSFKDCADKYIEIKSNVLSASTQRSYKGMLNAMPDWFKDTLLCDMDQLVIQKYINDITLTHKPKSIKNQHSFISAVFAMFCPEIKLTTTLPKIQKSEEYIPTSDDVKAVLEACKIEKYRIVFLLGCNGLRRSEILALGIDDIGDSSVKVNKAMVYTSDREWIIQPYGKTVESNRTVPISKQLGKDIKAQGYIYQGHPRKILEYLESCQKRAGVPHFKFHSLRHYYATELDQAGFSSKDVQKLGGWSSDAVLKVIYQHNRVDKDKEIQKKAAALIEKNLT